MNDNQRNDEIREGVSKAYAGLLNQQGGGCCGNQPKGNVAALAGYGSEEVTSLPSEAVVNSFGCGNPVAFSEVREGDVVLDLGSGAGLDLLLAAQKVGPTGSVIGVDMTDDMIEAARKNIAAAGVTNVEVRKGIIEKLPVESSSVDWVISNCVINLSPDKAAVFREIERVLKPGGRMVVSDITLEDAPDWIAEIESLYTSCVAGAVSEEEYISGLREAGLEEIEIRDKLAYEEASLKAFVADGGDDGGGCCGGGLAGDLVSRATKELSGKVASIRVAARKKN